MEVSNVEGSNLSLISLKSTLECVESHLLFFIQKVIFTLLRFDPFGIGLAQSIFNCCKFRPTFMGGF